MADPRITNVLTPKVADSTAPLTRGEVALKIISTTDDLQSVRRPLRLDGVISSIAKDGTSATIQTAKGDVTVQLRNNVSLQEGQNVQIDIPVGTPPRQSVLRDAPATSQQPQTQIPSQDTPATPATTPSQPTPGAAPTQQTQTNPAQSATPNSSQPIAEAQPTQPGLPPAPSTAQPALPTAVRSILDQAALPPLTTGPVTLPPTTLPANAIVRLIPLTGLSATTDLLPVPAAIQALIEQVIQPPDLLNPGAKPLFASDEFAAPLDSKLLALPGQIATPAPGTTLKTQITLPLSPFDARILTITPDAGFKPLPLNSFTIPTQEPGQPITPPQTKIFADVLAVTRQGFPLVSITLPGTTEPKIFMLQFPATNIPPGTRLEIEPAQILPVPGANTTPTTATATNPLTGWTWPVFDDVAKVLTQSMPQAQMAQTLANVMPSPARPGVMPPAMMFFMSAIQSGDIASWFGDKAISALRRDAARGGDALSRLTQDVDGLARAMDTPAQDWKGIAIPLVWQSEIQKIHLYYKNQGGEKDDDKEGGERSTRFIFDLNLTSLGDIQLDGMMKSRRLDLILRTGKMFSHSMQTAMRAKYQNVLELGKLNGDLVFQTRMDQWVRVKVNARTSNLGASA